MVCNRFKLFFLIGIFIFLTGFTQGGSGQKTTRQEYIEMFAKVAIQEMIQYHIPASITMAQACLESSDGNSPLATEGNNHFGIKCKNTWTGSTIRKDDDTLNECFRKYRNAIESFRDHSEFLTGSMRYQFLFDYNIKDYKKWAYGLKKAGYATNPQYPERLLKIIEDFQLYKLDDYFDNPNGYIGLQSREGSSKVISERWGNRGRSGLSVNPYLLRKVEKRNGANAFFSKQGDTYEQIAAEFSIKVSSIYRYNDIEPGERLEAGSIVYLQRKRGRAPRGNDLYTFKKGDTFWSVAQWYGIRLNALYRKNRIKKGELPVEGQQISLRLRAGR